MKCLRQYRESGRIESLPFRIKREESSLPVWIMGIWSIWKAEAPTVSAEGGLFIYEGTHKMG